MSAKLGSDTNSDVEGLIEGMGFGTLLLSTDNTIVSANRAARDMFGLSDVETAGRDLGSILWCEGCSDQQNDLSNVLTQMKGDVTPNADAPEGCLGQHVDGTQFAIEITAWPLPESFGNTRAIIVRDIDEEIQRDNRYKILFESSDYPQLIIVGDKFEYANEAAVQAFGCDSVEDLKSIHPSQISPEFQPDGRDSFSKAEEMMAAAYETGGHRFDWMHTKKNGVEMLMDVILTAMPHMGANALYCGYRDITERQKTEEVLRRTQKMDAIGQLTGGIAHDYNNILGIIKGNLELLKRRFPEDDFAQDRIQAALVGTVRGADITRKLLAFSHDKAQGASKVNVNQAIREFENLIGKSLTASVAIDLQLTKGLWPVEVDRGDFDNAVLNLALNARDAMEDGGTLTIETANKTLDEDFGARNEGAKAGDYVMITISDTGHGMSPEVVEKIFEPFFTTKPEGKGTGLGMSMVYGFINQSGGHVKIHSKPDAGTTFRIYLPRADVDGVLSAECDEEPAELARGTETVLVVDDEQALREVTCAQLESLGYNPVPASNGKEALEILDQRHDIQLMFSDVVMPGGFDGFQLAAKALESNPGLKVQLASGFTKQYENAPGVDAKSITALSRTLLSKPFNHRELAAAIRLALDNEEPT